MKVVVREEPCALFFRFGMDVVGGIGVVKVCQRGVSVLSNS